MQVKRWSNQQALRLKSNDQLGKGGQGIVCGVDSFPKLAAKVYPKPSDVPFQRLTAMLKNPPEDPQGKAGIQPAIAWPVDILLDSDGQPLGYLMPRISEVHPLLSYYSPSIRIKKCPGFTYRYLHRTAVNLACAFHAIHKAGYVVGDVKCENVLVSSTTLVTVVDTDSFQVQGSDGKIHYCPVGTPDYTPPEMQGKRFGEVALEVSHDHFGLAVMLFKLLMEGTHPFQGRYSGSGDPPLPFEAIRKGLYFYGGRTPLCAPSPNAPPMELLAPEIRNLFNQCFVDGHHNPACRPSALTWWRTLQRLDGATQ